MQLNFTHLPKTGQHSKQIVESQKSWLFIIRGLNVFDYNCKLFEIYAYTEKLIDISILYCDFRLGEINDHS